MRVVTIFLRGRHTEQILRDAQRHLKKLGRVIIVARDNEELPRIKQGETIRADQFISQFRGKIGDEIRLIANGGTTRQQVPVFAHLLSEAQKKEDIKLRLLDVQYSGVTEWDLEGRLIASVPKGGSERPLFVESLSGIL